jgi:hypothetical protein
MNALEKASSRITQGKDDVERRKSQLTMEQNQKSMSGN